MKIFTASLLALALAAGSGQALAQSAQPLPYDTQGFDDGYAGAGADGWRGDDEGHYDYARVLRVVPVIGAPGGYPSQVGGYVDPSCTSRDSALYRFSQRRPTTVSGTVVSSTARPSGQ